MEEAKRPNFSVVHMGINCGSEENARSAAQLFAGLFGFDYQEGRSSILAGNSTMELMKSVGRGTHGHIAIGTDDVDAAEAYLREKGCDFVEESRTTKDGHTLALYFRGEVAGFALHLVRNS